MTVKCFMLILSSGVAASAFAGSVCTWKGGSGCLSDDNWDVRPVSGNGDTLVFDTTDGSDITITNAEDDFDIAGIDFAYGSDMSGLGTVTFAGKRFYISSQTDYTRSCHVFGHPAAAGEFGPKVVFDAELRCTGGLFYVANLVTVNGKITIDGTGKVSFYWARGFNDAFDTCGRPAFGEIYGPDATFANVMGAGGNGQDVDFNGKLTLARFETSPQDLNSGRTASRLNCPGNAIGTIAHSYGSVYVMAERALPETALIENSKDEYGAGGVYFQCDQTIDRLTVSGRGADPSTPSVYGSASAAAPTLTMKASGATTIDNSFVGALSLVWDPQGDYSFTLATYGNKASSMTGSLEIRRGTFALSGDYARFTDLASLAVRSGATFDLSDSTASTPLNGTVVLHIDAGGKVVIPAGMTVAVKRAVVKGVGVPANSTYTQANSDFIEGEGSLFVTEAETGVTYWKAAESGDWSDGTKWSDGVPTAGKTVAYITAQGASYTVALDQDTANWPATTVVENRMPGMTASLAIAKTATCGDPVNAYTVGRGGRIVIPENGALRYDCANVPRYTTLLFDIQDGGEFKVDGGTVDISRWTGIFRVGSTTSVTSRLAVASGSFSLADAVNADPPYTASKLQINKGGHFDVSGGTVNFPANSPEGRLDMNGGVFDIHGESVFKTDKLAYSSNLAFGTGLTHFFGEAQVDFAGNSGDPCPQVKPNAAGERAILRFDGNSRIARGAYMMRVGRMADATGTVEYASAAAGVSSLGHIVVLGDNAGVGELYVTEGSASAASKGLAVGASYGLGADDSSEGRLVVDGGILTVNGEGAYHPSFGWGYNWTSGLIVGSGATNAKAGRETFKGAVEVRNGSLENEGGYFFVGEGNGTGRFVQTGGSVRSGRWLYSSSTYEGFRDGIPVAVGACGGYGEMYLSNGTFVAWSPLYVGGVSFDMLREKDNPRISANYPKNLHDAFGFLEIVDANLICSNKVTVAEDGTGTLAFACGRGKLEAAELKLKNSSATLKFTVDGAATATGDVGVLSVGTGANVVVDFCGKKLAKAYTALTFGTVVGSFADANIVVLNNPDGNSVKVTDRSIRIAPPAKGTCLIVR